MKTFDDLVFKQIPLSYLEAAKMSFDNGFEISVYPNMENKDKFDIIILKNNKICYANGINSPLCKKRITSIMAQLQRIKKR